MSNTEHPAGGPPRWFRGTFGPVRPVREVELVWPPTDDDIAAFSIVRLDAGNAEPSRVEPPPVEAPPVEPARAEAVRHEPLRFEPRGIKPTFGDRRARGAARRALTLVVPMEPPPLPGPPLPDPPAVAPPVVPQDAQVADVPADDTMVAAPEVWAIRRRPIPAAALPPDPETIGAGQIGVAGGVLRGGVCAGDGRRISRRRHVAGGRRGAASAGAGVRRGRAGAGCEPGADVGVAEAGHAEARTRSARPPSRLGQSRRRRRSSLARQSRRHPSLA